VQTSQNCLYYSFILEGVFKEVYINNKKKWYFLLHQQHQHTCEEGSFSNHHVTVPKLYKRLCVPLFETSSFCGAQMTMSGNVFYLIIEIDPIFKMCFKKTCRRSCRNNNAYPNIQLSTTQHNTTHNTNIAHDTLHAFKTIIGVCFHTFQNSWR
jgi:hypothetical protein